MRRVWLLLVVLVLMLTAACGRSSFTTPASEDGIKQKLVESGLKVCQEEPLTWTTVPGFVSGKHVTVGIDCGQPGVGVTVAKFDSVEARDGAMRNLETSSRVAGNRIGRTLGPYVISIEGLRSDAAVQRIVKALDAAGAK
jgi:hypothetical protein